MERERILVPAYIKRSEKLMSIEEKIQVAQKRLDEHTREMVKWHFSPETGCPFWLEWAKSAGWDPVKDIQSFADMARFPHFKDEYLRDEPNERWIPKQFEGKPFKVFETGGTTGMPKQRISWEDHLTDYTEFSNTLDEKAFPKGANWMMLGPTGPRRLRLSIEHLANIRGGSCYFADLDPRWVKKLIGDQKFDQANAYKEHVVDQAVTILKGRNIGCLFTTPKLLESLSEKISIPGVGIKGVFVGGTSMTTQEIRFLVEEVLENETFFLPTYGNTLMGLACSKPVTAEEGYTLTYYAPQPRAVLRIVDPKESEKTVDYGEWGRVELTTMTKEFFMPRFLERDEAIRREPWERFPWEGVGEVRPFGASEKKIVEGVY
jgi:phenylacetate-coenzyme A ligase PaaK-like adenylate-forming protein